MPKSRIPHVTVTVRMLRLFTDMGPAAAHWTPRANDVVIDGQHVAAQPDCRTAPGLGISKTERPLDGNREMDEAGLEKRHGLQGPIDDAFSTASSWCALTEAPWRAEWPRLGEQ